MEDMGKRYVTEPIRITDIQPGFELAIQSGDDTVKRFVVDDIKVRHDKAAGEEPGYSLTSRLPDGTESKLNFHIGALAVRIVGVEDDGVEEDDPSE